MNITAPIINSIGLIFDIIGAILVAIEVVNNFKGIQYKDLPGGWCANNPAPEKTEEYEKWEKNKFKTMQCGLAFLIIGFALQFVSNVITIRSVPSIQQPVQSHTQIQNSQEQSKNK